MKNIFLSGITSIIVVFTAVSCNQSSSKKDGDNIAESSSATKVTTALKNENIDTLAVAKKADTTTKPAEKTTAALAIKSFSIAPIIKDYLSLKNAMVADNDKATADAGKKLLATFKAVDIQSIPAAKHKEYMDIADDAQENAEHIGDNAGKIDHQREHFASLSKDVSDLITLFGTSQKLYQDYCPMFNEGKGAIWISEAKAIKNPYYGNKMLTCGSVKKVY